MPSCKLSFLIPVSLKTRLGQPSSSSLCQFLSSVLCKGLHATWMNCPSYWLSHDVRATLWGEVWAQLTFSEEQKLPFSPSLYICTCFELRAVEWDWFPKTRGKSHDLSGPTLIRLCKLHVAVCGTVDTEALTDEQAPAGEGVQIPVWPPREDALTLSR